MKKTSKLVFFSLLKEKCHRLPRDGAHDFYLLKGFTPYRNKEPIEGYISLFTSINRLPLKNV